MNPLHIEVEDPKEGEIYKTPDTYLEVQEFE